MEKNTRLVEYYRDDSGRSQLGPSTATIFYSQCGEDLETYIEFFHKEIDLFKNNGTYIEMGASDGVKFSNTKYFEDEHGFTGILIEPVKKFHQTLKLTRRYNKIYNCAVSEKSGKVGILVGQPGQGDAWVSGMPQTMSKSKKHLKDWHSGNKNIEFVESKKLSDIFEENDTKYIDIFSLDVEGAEYEVLKTMNWDIPVYVMIIELNEGEDEQEKDIQCREILKFHSFKFFKRVGLSEIWYNPNYLNFRRNLV
jgi:FkbM family methyltransferase